MSRKIELPVQRPNEAILISPRRIPGVPGNRNIVTPERRETGTSGCVIDAIPNKCNTFFMYTDSVDYQLL